MPWLKKINLNIKKNYKLKPRTYNNMNQPLPSTTSHNVGIIYYVVDI